PSSRTSIRQVAGTTRTAPARSSQEPDPTAEGKRDAVAAASGDESTARTASSAVKDGVASARLAGGRLWDALCGSQAINSASTSASATRPSPGHLLWQP